MKILNILVTFSLLLLPYTSFGQGSGSGNSVMPFIGLATYKMSDLKEFNEQMGAALPFDVKIVDNFSPGVFYGITFKRHLVSNLNIGLSYQYNSTGSRIGQRDYSGSFSFDQIINGHLIGVVPEVVMYEGAKSELNLILMTGVQFTGIKMNENLEIGGSQDHSSENLSASSIVFCPSIRFNLKIKNNLMFSLSPGALLDSGGKVHLTGNRNALLGLNDKAVKTGWTGIRLSAGISWEPRTKKPSEKSE